MIRCDNVFVGRLDLDSSAVKGGVGRRGAVIKY
jgi:hypothetical protein